MFQSFGSLIELSVRLKNAENRMIKIFNQKGDQNELSNLESLGYIEIRNPYKKTDSYFKTRDIEDKKPLDEPQKVTSSQEMTKISVKPQHRCHYCPYFCDSRFHLRRHISSVHNGEKSYKCYVCNKEFSRSEKVKQHFLNIHPGIQYEAKRTRKNMLSMNVIEMKLKKNKPATENGDTIMEDIDSDRAWSKFCKIQNTYTNNAFVCIRCSYEGPHIWKMKEHFLVEHMQSNAYLCRTCHYVAYTFERLVGHMQGHGELYCVQCSYSTTDIEDYSRHTDVCSTARTCQVCNAVQPNGPSLIDHYKQSHNICDLRLCNLCIFATTSAEDMAAHEGTHTPMVVSDTSDTQTINRYHPCVYDGCKFTSVWKKCLELHVENFHKSEAEIFAPGYFPPCSFCPSFRTFKYKKSYEKHLMQHGLKAAQCAKFMSEFYIDGD